MKTETKSQHKGRLGESLFVTYIEKLIFQIKVPHVAFRECKNTRTGYVRAIKFHQEDDLGADFDVEVFWENEKGYEPSGIHFLAQVKNWETQPKFSKDDFDYYYRQRRPVLLVWIKDEIMKVVDFVKWIELPENNNRINILKKGDCIDFTNDWKVLETEWLSNYISSIHTKIIEGTNNIKLFQDLLIEGVKTISAIFISHGYLEKKNVNNKPSKIIVKEFVKKDKEIIILGFETYENNRMVSDITMGNLGIGYDSQSIFTNAVGELMEKGVIPNEVYNPYNHIIFVTLGGKDDIEKSIQRLYKQGNFHVIQADLQDEQIQDLAKTLKLIKQ